MRSQVQGSALPLFIGDYEFKLHRFQPTCLNIIKQFDFYSISLRAYESMDQIEPQPKPLNLEPLNGYERS